MFAVIVRCVTRTRTYAPTHTHTCTRKHKHTHTRTNTLACDTGTGSTEAVRHGATLCHTHTHTRAHTHTHTKAQKHRSTHTHTHTHTCMHATQALAARKPFAVVLCCVFPTAFPHRRVSVPQHATNVTLAHSISFARREVDLCRGFEEGEEDTYSTSSRETGCRRGRVGDCEEKEGELGRGTCEEKEGEWGRGMGEEREGGWRRGMGEGKEGEWGRGTGEGGDRGLDRGVAVTRRVWLPVRGNEEFILYLLECNNGIGGFHEKFPSLPPLLHPSICCRARRRVLFFVLKYLVCVRVCVCGHAVVECAGACVCVIGV